MHNIIKRSLSAIILAPIVIGMILWHPVSFYCLLMIAYLIMWKEWIYITCEDKIRVKWLVVGFFYTILPILSWAYLYELYTTKIILLIIVLIWAVDIGAYIFGKTIGGPKVAPKISPNKTWTGLFGAIIFSIVTFLIIVSIIIIKDEFSPKLTEQDSVYIAYLFSTMLETLTSSSAEELLMLIIIPAGFAIIAQAGDFFQSWVKRKFNKKDSGNLIPGHGGLLDRIDGLIFVSVVAAIVRLLAW